MHPALLRAYQIMRPRIEAERMLADYQVALMASGRMRPEEQRARLRELDRTASGHKPTARRRPRDNRAVAQLGIRVIEE